MARPAPACHGRRQVLLSARPFGIGEVARIDHLQTHQRTELPGYCFTKHALTGLTWLYGIQALVTI